MADDLISAIDAGGIDKDEYGNMVKFFNSLTKEAVSWIQRPVSGPLCR